MSELELPDPQSIPLPDDIPLPPEEGASNVDEPHTRRTDKRREEAAAGEEEEEGQEQRLMRQMMGFSSFNSTKGKMVPGNQTIGAVHVVKKRRYRQYMNRKGGFNRPLDKVA